MKPTKSEHLEWCKRRALEHVDAGDLPQAVTSMLSDLRKHEETRDHPGIVLGAMLMFGGYLTATAEVRKFIEGFH